jgi:hypothetical protein
MVILFDPVILRVVFVFVLENGHGELAPDSYISHIYLGLIS